ncbi:MAG TPA: hypothetical protein VGF97_10650 [Rhizomicrobium sp.]|jgi:photosystem II stability/assembly factor-like uncharacterized protein
MTNMPFLNATLVGVAVLFGGTAFGQPISAVPSTHYVSARLPFIGQSREVGADRPAGLSSGLRAMTPAGHPANTWTKLATLPGAVVHDVAFADSLVGYAAAELGEVWKTTNGGKSWTLILNRGFPYYYYGISVSGKMVTASGFNDNNSEAILTQSQDSGATWGTDTILSTNAWGGRVRFAHGQKSGLAMSGEGLASPNAAWWRVKPANWAQVTPDPNGGWFGYQFTLLKDQTAYASGVTFCKSANTGATWTCAPPADSVFDGPTEFVSDKAGWTGGGEISPNVEGWLHRTTDGGASWSGRVLNTPWPIRQITFLNKKVGWAAGGNIYSNVGGIYYSADGGKTWALDFSSGDEIGSCASQPVAGGQVQLWCIGDAYNGSSFNSNVYSAVVSAPK